MSTGRKHFMVVPLDSGHYYCGAYHCAGDCGLPHSEKERAQQFTAAGQAAERKRLTMAAFDALTADERKARKEAQQQVRRRAKDSQ